MYWTDWEEEPTGTNRGSIKRAWMDGTNAGVFLTAKTVLWPNGLTLDIPQGILYWVDAFYDRIEMVFINTTERQVRDRDPSDMNTATETWSCSLHADWLLIIHNQPHVQ